MKIDKNPLPTYVLAASVAGQIGCLISIIVGVAVILGLVLDQALGTKHLFIFLFMVGSIPLNLGAIFWFTRYQAKRLKTLPPQKEDNISGN
jgi:hypothetical protein